MDATLRYKGFKLRYGLDWIAGDSSKTYAYFQEDPATSTFYLKTPNYFLHSLSVSFENDHFLFTAGVRNLLDTDPPRVSTTFGQVYSQVGNAPLYSGYDYIGRTFFVSFTGKY
jgi:outer membrane receptor protein involved in Fe transport